MPDQPAQNPPPVQRLRVRYAKRGRLRFTSHRDFSRAFERALRRAGVPMAYSSGFSPHPRISYANASPTGAASEAEYLEIGLAQACDPEAVRAALDAALPDGLDIIAVVPAPPGALADLLTGSRWLVSLDPVAQAELPAAIATFLAAETVVVQRMTKNGIRDFDTRSAVVQLVPADPGLILTLRHQIPLVRPDDVLLALGMLSPTFRPAGVPVLTRLTQGRLASDTADITEPDGSPSPA